jgi:hypothetical protein
VSYIFESEDKVVWSPASRVGRLFVALADALSAMLSVPHGLSPMAEDYYEIERSQFRDFVEALNREYPEHRVSRSILRGFLLTSLVMLDRMGASVQEELDANTVAGMEEMSSAMPES